MIDPALLPYLLFGATFGLVAGLWLMARVLEYIIGGRWM